MLGFCVCNSNLILRLFPRLLEDEQDWEKARTGKVQGSAAADTPPRAATPPHTLEGWSGASPSSSIRTKPPGPCWLFVRGAFTLGCTHGLGAVLGLWPCGGKTRDAAGHPVSTQPHRLQTSPAGGEANPRLPRALSADDQLTSRSRPPLGSRMPRGGLWEM